MALVEKTKADEIRKKELIIDEILETKKLNIEELYLIVKYAMGAYIGAVKTFGFRGDVSKKSLRVIRDFWKVLREENYLMNFLMTNIDILDNDAVERFMSLLNELNNKTVSYYYDYIESIEDACVTIEEKMAMKPQKDFETLTESSVYREEAVSLLENLESIKAFLGFPEDFWLYINDKVDVVNVDAKAMEKMFYAVAVLNEDNTINSIKVLVPEVVDYDSAMIAINIYNKAYELYKKLGTKADSLNLDHSDELKDEFSDVYIPRKTSQVLKKKM